MTKINIAAFDLDGTLLNSDKKVSLNDVNTLKLLNKKNIVRIVATGRNLYSLQKVLDKDFPVDYAVFSSGAGIFDWKNQKILQKWSITNSDINKIITAIEPYKLNFTIHLPIPHNHHIIIYDKHIDSHDLQNYVRFYKDYTQPFNRNNIPKMATQMVILLNGNTDLYDKLKKEFSPLKSIRATSPVDLKSNWLEVFNGEVSKANGVKWIINYLKIKNPRVYAIGNDYNDSDLLNYANYSFIVSNAPEDLKKKYTNTLSNNENAFSESILNFI